MADKTIKVISLTTTQQLMISELVEVAELILANPIVNWLILSVLIHRGVRLL